MLELRNSLEVCCEDTELLDMRVANGAPRQCKACLGIPLRIRVGFKVGDPTFHHVPPEVVGCPNLNCGQVAHAGLEDDAGFVLWLA